MRYYIKDRKKLSSCIYWHLLQNSGGTFDFNGNEVKRKTGYFVSFSYPSINLELIKIKQGDILDFISFVENKSLIYKSVYIGYWFNKTDKNIYLDLSVHIPTKERALNFAKTQNQITIWDCKNNLEITL